MKHYVYRHRRLDTNEVFYIGLGTRYPKEVTTFNRANTTKDRSKFWKKVVDKTGYTVEIIYQSNVYEDMKELEIFLISLYGRRDL